MKMEIATLVIRLGILLITAFIAPAFRSWLDSRAKDARAERLKEWARQAVRAAEQIRKQMDTEDPAGTIRKRNAVRFLVEACRRAGIKLEESEITALIESAVYELNKDHM